MKIFITKKDGVITDSGIKDCLLLLKDGTYSVEIVRKTNIRTVPQNNLYWSWLTELQENSGIGYTADEWHTVFSHFRSESTRSPIDRRKKIKRIKSTTEMTTKEYSVYLQKIQAIGRDFCGYNLEFPDDFIYE